MNNSIKLAFSFLFNAKQIIESEKDNVKGIFNLRHSHFQKAKPYTKAIAKRIYNELENNYYIPIPIVLPIPATITFAIAPIKIPLALVGLPGSKLVNPQTLPQNIEIYDSADYSQYPKN